MKTISKACDLFCARFTSLSQVCNQLNWHTLWWCIHQSVLLLVFIFCVCVRSGREHPYQPFDSICHFLGVAGGGGLVYQDPRYEDPPAWHTHPHTHARARAHAQVHIYKKDGLRPLQNNFLFPVSRPTHFLEKIEFFCLTSLFCQVNSHDPCCCSIGACFR